MSTNYRITDGTVPHFLTMTTVEWVDLFSREKYKEILIESLSYCLEEKNLIINAYVIMTNHVHLIARSKEQGDALRNTIRDFKRYTAKRIYEELKTDPNESRRNWLLWIFESQGKRSSSNENFKIWQHENHPVILDSNHLQDERLNYVHENPVRAGICYTATDYKYSSAGAYAGEPGLIKLEFIE